MKTPFEIVGEQMDVIADAVSSTFSRKKFTWKELEDMYYEIHSCDSDDVDAENAKVERWADDMGYECSD